MIKKKRWVAGMDNLYRSKANLEREMAVLKQMVGKVCEMDG